MNKEVRTFAGGQPFWYNPETTFCVIPLEKERVAELRLGDFKVQGLASTAWAFATASQQDAQLFEALASAVEWDQFEFDARNLA